MVRLMIKHPLSSPRFQYTVIPTSDPLKIRLKQILITGVPEKKHHHHHHHHHHRSGEKKSKHGHKHKYSGRKSLDLSLRLGLSGKDQQATSTATSKGTMMNKIKKLGVYTQQQEDEDKFYGVSTKLALFDYRL
ncbi:hypothetical protein DCAR_0624324 [Daucus carota subsp. sativus]|uniref:Uncharacterized protein n=1 Tax=Daucus carota subsp. sativus TaxID=79200 RepID=A0A164VS11_DAUCS|nr:hypothetical protein DCAR_0624324 [Daucus carota subsp. sativus]